MDYKKQLAETTSKAYREKRTQNKRSDMTGEKGNALAGKQKPPRKLLEEVVHTATADKRGKKKTANVKASSSASSASKKEKNCSIM